MSLHKHLLAGVCLATVLLGGQAMAATDNDSAGAKAEEHTGVHVETRDGANETAEGNKGKGTGILGTGPVKQRAEDQKPGKAEKMYDNQYETDRTKKKAN